MCVIPILILAALTVVWSLGESYGSARPETEIGPVLGTILLTLGAILLHGVSGIGRNAELGGEPLPWWARTPDVSPCFLIAGCAAAFPVLFHASVRLARLGEDRKNVS
jgi:hypothetical protein